jgi:hypothetical protein
MRTNNPADQEKAIVYNVLVGNTAALQTGLTKQRRFTSCIAEVLRPPPRISPISVPLLHEQGEALRRISSPN